MSQQTMWPAGRESAACFTFDLDGEEVWIANLQAADRPGVLSQGTYGPKVAVPLILDILRRHQVAATFFVPGRVAERHPGAVRAILTDSHEIGYHGYTHRSPADLSAAEEESELVLGRRALEQLGAQLRGYRAPSWDTSERTVGLLAEHGFSYSSNLMDDIRPYQHPGTSLIELPVHWLLDDAAHFWFSLGNWDKTIRSAAEVRQLWSEEASGIAGLGGIAVWTFHPQVIGRPGRLRLLDELIGATVADSSVWVARADEVASAAALNEADPDRARSGRTS
jgi:peptidoglycan/xylan/chitin deacetylase (PgdA/CDA1 family)